jgi:hypothetical protein
MQLKTFEKMRSDYVGEIQSRPRTAVDIPPNLSFEQIPATSHEASQASGLQQSRAKIQQPTQKRPKFDASSFIREMESYEQDRAKTQSYLVGES